jgi:MoaA/NifB/PqqE/SkfB family radical SAM enzyme
VRKLLTAYVKNSARALFTGSSWFDPLLPTLYVTPMCNLRCTYCEDFGAHRNAEYRGQTLSTGEMKGVVDLIAEACDLLYVTGGEPTMRPDLPDLLRHARGRGIRYLAMNTNAVRLDEHADVLDLVDNLVISLDDLTSGRWDSTLAAEPERVARLLDNIRWAADRRRARGAALTITCVVMPGRVSAARRVRGFAEEVRAEFSAQHLSVGRIPSAALTADPEYVAFMRELLADKRAGGRVSGSELYLGRPGASATCGCTPTAAPHVDWLGRLAFPCRELPDHVLVDLRAAGSLGAALREGARRWGPPPSDCRRCGERCYVEISTLVRHPGALAREAIHYLRAARPAAE